MDQIDLGFAPNGPRDFEKKRFFKALCVCKTDTFSGGRNMSPRRVCHVGGRGQRTVAPCCQFSATKDHGIRLESRPYRSTALQLSGQKE